MIYLIGQLAVWLLLTAISAGVAGWMFAAQRGEPKRMALRRDRDKLIRDLSHLAAGEEDLSRIEAQRTRAEAGESLARIREGRIAELEHALEFARGRADEAAAEIATLRRDSERSVQMGEEIAHLREELANLRRENARLGGVETEHRALLAREEDRAARAAAEEEANTLQAWRLRYFERRVAYLENNAANGAPPKLAEWRARDAEARATHLEDELRSLNAPQSAEGEGAPFASDADVDVLLRWRMLYLERRVAHLQAQAGEAPAAPQPAVASAPDPDRWKWRARYLEARVRHLEQRPATVAAPAAQPLADVAEAPEAAPAPQARRTKPPVLNAARSGAPDDFTLIDSISLLQQTTLNSIGIFHYDQIAAWTPENVAWIDNYLRLRGRIGKEEWIEQAADLAREGPAAARRMPEDADA